MATRTHELRTARSMPTTDGMRRRRAGLRVAVAAGTTALALGVLAMPASSAPLSLQLNSSTNQLSGITVRAGLGLDKTLNAASNQLSGINASAGLGIDQTLNAAVNGLATVTARVVITPPTTVPETPPTTVPETPPTHPTQD